jgi:serine protease Do
VPTIAPATSAPVATSTPAATGTPAPVDSGAVLALGQTVENTLPVGGRHEYTFTATGGQPVRVDLLSLQSTPGTLDPYLELYGPEGYFLYENDDWDYGQVNARLEVVLPTTGTYTLVVRSYADGSGGLYQLRLQVGAIWG